MILKKLKNRATGWRPLVLHWRRRRVLRPILKRDRVSSSVTISYFTQIHFHFTTRLTQNYQSAVQKIISSSQVNRERLLSERHLETRIRKNSIYRTNNNQISAPLFYGFIKHLSLYSSSTHSAPIPNQIHQPRASVPFKSVSPLLLHTRHAELINVFTTRSRVREHQSQILSFRSASHESLVKTSREQFVRAEELVWRERPVDHVAQTTKQQSVNTPAVSTQVQSVSSSSSQTTPQQVTKLDPRLLDRLAEDVIRRVEKRALIERARRGL